MSDVNNATTIARASAALADDIGTADMPDALRHIAEQGPRTYAEQIIAHALTHAADVIEELTAELRVTQRQAAVTIGRRHHPQCTAPPDHAPNLHVAENAGSGPQWCDGTGVTP